MAWNKGMKMSKDYRKKLSLVHIGIKHSEKTKLKISRSSKGKKKSSEAIEKTRLANIGKKKSEEAKLKMSLAKKGKPSLKKGKNYPKTWKSNSEQSLRRRARLVMEEYLGRKLIKGLEEIHHLDHDPKNNSIDNLHLFKSKKEHTSYHWFLRKLVKNELEALI